MYCSRHVIDLFLLKVTNMVYFCSCARFFVGRKAMFDSDFKAGKLSNSSLLLTMDLGNSIHQNDEPVSVHNVLVLLGQGSFL